MEQKSIERELNKNSSLLEERLTSISEIINTNEDLMLKNNDQFLSDLESRGLINAKKRYVYSHNPSDMGHIMTQERFNLSIMPILFRQGFVIIGYSVFEIAMNNLATICEDFAGSKIKIKDLVSRGSDVERSINYLRKVIDVSFDEIDNLRIRLDEYRMIRNLIVHYHGDIEYFREKNPSSTKSINRYHQIVQNDPDLHFGNGVLFISKTYILKHIQIMQDFIHSISISISRRMS